LNIASTQMTVVKMMVLRVIASMAAVPLRVSTMVVKMLMTLPSFAQRVDEDHDFPSRAGCLIWVDSQG